jgi:fructose-1,6-bisphosphatase/inositol monophosphatase family enzyme
MENFKELLLELDEKLLTIFSEFSQDISSVDKTDHINALGDTSLKMDLKLEDAIIEFFKSKDFPCIIEAEERGRTILSENPKYLVIADPLDGSSNYRKGIPLVCCGVAIAKIKNQTKTAFFSDIKAAFVRSLFTNEFYFAEKNSSVTLNTNQITCSPVTSLSKAFISIDIDHLPKKERSLFSKLKDLVIKCRGTRRFGTNLLDIVYVGAGKIEVMIDLRGTLSVVHVSSLFISQEAGASIYSPTQTPFNPELKTKNRMKFIIANNESILEKIKEILEI